MEQALIKSIKLRVKMVIALSIFGIVATAVLETISYLLTQLSL
jgi:hypothetical protein